MIVDIAFWAALVLMMLVVGGGGIALMAYLAAEWVTRSPRD